MADAATLHVTFTESGAAELRKVFTASGMNHRAIAPFDDLTYGPIRDSTTEDRIAWVESVLGYCDSSPREWVREIDAFWEEAEAIDDRSFVWVSGRVAKEVAGLMALISRRGGKPLRIIDLTDFRGSGGQRMPALGLLSQETLEARRPWEQSRLLTPDECSQRLETWGRLQAENAPLRVLSEGNLVSAPITHFDELLLTFATSEWRKMAYLVGYSLGEQTEADIYQCGDLVLAARARALAKSGRLEWRGDLAEMRTSEVRLPA